MKLNRTGFVRLLKILAFVFVALILVVYATSRSLPYARGLTINIYQPIDGSTVASTTVDVIGKASRITALTLNGNPISTDESGNFKEKLILFPGVNLITLEGQDQFGRTEKTRLEIYRPR